MGKKHLAGWETTQWVKKNKKTTSFKKLISFLFKVPLRCLPSSKVFEPCDDFSEKGGLRASSPIWARRKPRENAGASGKAAGGRGKESLQRSLINFHLYFAQTPRKILLAEKWRSGDQSWSNSPSWPALILETRCSYRQNPCCVGDRWTYSEKTEKKTSRGRNSLSPSLRDNCRLCVKFGSQGDHIGTENLFQKKSKRALLMWFSKSCTCESVGLPIEYCKPRIGRTEFVVLVEVACSRLRDSWARWI